MSRNLLHKTKLEAFKEWITDQGLEHRPGNGEGQVLQVCKDGKNWYPVYSRMEMPEHYTTDWRLDSLVGIFCRRLREIKC